VNERVNQIEQCLRAALAPLRLNIEDESAKHAGHAGAREGGGHFDVTIVASQFSGKSLLQRHRLVYDALGEAMRKDIHALSIHALTPDEADHNPKETP